MSAVASTGLIAITLRGNFTQEWFCNALPIIGTVSSAQSPTSFVVSWFIDGHGIVDLPISLDVQADGAVDWIVDCEVAPECWLTLAIVFALLHRKETYSVIKLAKQQTTVADATLAIALAPTPNEGRRMLADLGFVHPSMAMFLPKSQSIVDF